MNWDTIIVIASLGGFVAFVLFVYWWTEKKD
jgi:hypothetical protein